MTELQELPQPQEFFLTAGLYQPFLPDRNRLEAIEQYQGSLDMYCIQCRDMSVYNRGATKATLDAWMAQRGGWAGTMLSGGTPPALERRLWESLRGGDRVFLVELECSRDAGHRALFIVRACQDEVCKIGQFPSRADLELPRLGKYRKMLGDQYGELARAVGLAAHGIGIGSFVYLRRIFERLVEESAAAKEQAEPAWNRSTWQTKRMDERLRELKGYLPDFGVENRSLYELLSAGLHVWSEEDCKRHFEALELAIEVILDEKLNKAEVDRKRTQAHMSLSRLGSERAPRA